MFSKYFKGQDEIHETMKQYNYKSEVGDIVKRNNRFVWVTKKKECFQKPKGGKNE